jgi:hypothetical protein
MTPIDIVNIGIEALGERPISSFNEGSVAAIAARSTFRAALSYVLEEAHWNDAAGRALLAAEATAPAPGYSRQFVLPADCLKVRSLYGTSLKWAREGRRLLTDAASPVSLLYTRDLGRNAAGQDVAPAEDMQVGGLLSTAIAYRWASWNAKRICGSDAVAQEMERQFGLALIRAIASDAAEGTVDPQEVGSWVDSRAADAWA